MIGQPIFFKTKCFQAFYDIFYRAASVLQNTLYCDFPVSYAEIENDFWVFYETIAAW